MKSVAFAVVLMVFLPQQIHEENRMQERELPKVLLIGDSISLGYTPHVSRLLEAEAVVFHHPGNAEHTGTGLAMLAEWLGETQWDLIHFNWGLWDLCYRHPDSIQQGNRDKINGTITTTLDQYERNLEQLVLRLKETNAVLIWANTTVVPEGEAGRFVGDDTRYNEVAAKVMKKHDIVVNDLHRQTDQFSADLFVSPGNVHFTNEGYVLIAEKVARQISDSIR